MRLGHCWDQLVGDAEFQTSPLLPATSSRSMQDPISLPSFLPLPILPFCHFTPTMSNQSKVLKIDFENLYVFFQNKTCILVSHCTSHPHSYFFHSVLLRSVHIATCTLKILLANAAWCPMPSTQQLSFTLPVMVTWLVLASPS